MATNPMALLGQTAMTCVITGNSNNVGTACGYQAYAANWYASQVTTINTPNYIQFDMGTITTNGTNADVYGVQPETEEQRIEREAREAERRKRARETLISLLTAAQREQLETHEHFELRVNDRLYRIRPGSRVERLDPASKKVTSFFCIHPESHHGLPCEDVALGQKLLLEADEARFLAIANETKAA